MNIEVTGCKDCLLRELLASGRSWCNHPKLEGFIYEEGDGTFTTPSNCPLFKEPLTLSIKQ